MTYEIPILSEPPDDPAAVPREEGPSNKRVFARMQPFWLHCDVGYVLDISMNGMKVLSRRALKGDVALRLWDDKLGLNLNAEVMWSRRIRFRQHEIGLRFHPLSQEQLPELIQLAAQFHE